MLGDVQLLDPLAGAQLPGVSTLGLPLARRHPAPPHDAVRPPVDICERQSNRSSVADDFDEAGVGKGLAEQRDATVVGDALVDERGAAAGAGDSAERAAEDIYIGAAVGAGAG